MHSLGLPGLAVLAFFAFVCFAILLIPMVFFLLTVQRTLTRCAPQNRALTPGLVWLLLIPMFGFVWAFIIVDAVTRSLRDEFRMRQVAVEADPARGIGLAWAILMVCGIVPVLGLFAELAAFVCWIIYWVKIADFSKKLALPAGAIAASAAN